MKHRLVAIHQPNFIPWLGFFNKIHRADIFIALDSVQFQKTGGTWTNRVRILIQGQPHWMTIPIVRAYHGTRAINEMEINDSHPWREKMIRTIDMNYSRAPYFDCVRPWVKQWISHPSRNIAEFNLFSIGEIMRILDLNSSKLVLSSGLKVNGQSTDLLVSLIRSVSGTAYLCGGGATEYQEDERFAAAGIRLVYQEFQHPVYPHFNSKEFVPGLSVLDVLFNCGPERTGELVRGEPR